MKVFSPLLKLKTGEAFRWDSVHQEAFDQIKAYLTRPPVLMPPRKGVPLKLYVSVAEASIGSLLAQDNEARKEQAVFYLSWALTEVERRYPVIEKLCLVLFFSCSKLRYYLLPTTVNVARKLIQGFQDVVLRHIPRLKNQAVNGLVQAVSGIGLPEGSLERTIVIKRQTRSSILEGSQLVVNYIEDTQPDWRTPITQYLSSPEPEFNRKIRDRAIGYELIGGDLYKKGKDDLLLKCVSLNEATLIMAEVHEGICGAYQAGPKMRWLIRRHRYYWPMVVKNCVRYAKGCWACQTHGPVQWLPTTEFNLVIKPWPFKGWAKDLIGKITPLATRGHCFIIVAINYFTKWVEAVPMKGVSQMDVIQFLKSHIIHRFGLPETITCDNGSIFTVDEVIAYAAELGITFTHSTPYYAQDNGQAEASNKILKGFLAKVVDDNPQRWADMLSEVLWAFRTSHRTNTATTPFALTYGHDTVVRVQDFHQYSLYARFNALGWASMLTPTEHCYPYLVWYFYCNVVPSSAQEFGVENRVKDVDIRLTTASLAEILSFT
ncbi:uncharacterized protein LOC122650653 [Telopea speciosissima]|uniref:uncharacterized protein LOC122650653 n=1 Tax=Telopea speciosissima TaxID=54955 RepID=UPI001CC7F138|nr:uncharacterized protein LOC122650653 [Telopea speciosissima]